MARKYYYGIDLGTTHTLVVKANKENGEWKYEALKLPNKPLSSAESVTYTELLPSVVYFPRKGTPIVGEHAKRAIHIDPERVYLNSKMDLGAIRQKNDSSNTTSFHGHTPLEVQKEILKVCYAQIFRDGGANAQVRISVPAAFTQDERADTADAARRAKEELNYENRDLPTIEEPSAALLNFVINDESTASNIKIEKDNETTLMLVDIGGGTMDILIATISYDPITQLLNVDYPYAPPKNDKFAGATFDYELMKKFVKDFCYHHELDYEKDLIHSERELLEKNMLLYAEDAKKFLCENKDKSYRLTPDFDKLNVDKNNPFEIQLTKGKMDIDFGKLLNNPNARSITFYVKKTLENNHLTSHDIDFVYLTGGMANYDKIAEAIENVVKKPVIVAKEPLYSIAKGVAVSNIVDIDGELSQMPQQFVDIFEENNISQDNSKNKETENTNKKVNVQISQSQKIGMSYFVDVDGELPVEIIPKEEEYPCFNKRAKRQLKTSSQSRMTLVLYEGYNVYDSNMKVLRQKVIEFDEMMKIGTPIDISYEIDENKIITIFASIGGEPPIKFDTKEDD